MNQSTKQRVVGIAVIAFAAAVILPVLFDGQGSYELPLESRIPDPEPFPTPPRLTPERPVIVADTEQVRVVEPSVPAPVVDTSALEQSQNTDTAVAEPAQPAPSIAEVTAPAPTSTAPGLDPVGLPEGWSVRLASFSDEANAQNLLDILQSNGHRAYTRKIDSSQGTLTAVFVGPGVDRDAVQQLQQQLRAETQLAGIVVRYEVEEL